MDYNFEGRLFVAKSKADAKRQVEKYIFDTHGKSIEEYYDGNKCPYSGKYARVVLSVSEDHAITIQYYSSAIYACLHTSCKCQSLNRVSREFLINCRGMSETEATDFLKNKGRKTWETSLEDKNMTNPAIRAHFGKNPASLAELTLSLGSKENAQQFLFDKANKAKETKMENGYFDDISNNPFSKLFWEKKGYSEQDAQLKVNQRNFWTSCSNIDIENPGKLKYWTDKYGDKLGEDLFNDKTKRGAYSRSLKGHIEKYGEADGKDRYNKTLKAKTGHLGASSTVAKLFFIKVYKFSRRCGISRSDIRFTINGSTEYTIFDESASKTFRYDFTILSKNIIIEYNGSLWHPRRSRMSREEYENWKMPWSDLEAYQKENNDMYKIEVAIENGFSLLEIWDTETTTENFEKCKNFLLEMI